MRGKINPSYRPNVMPSEEVIVSNINLIKLTGKKSDQKIYYHYSGYPSGMKARKYKTVFEKDPKKVLQLAVYGMLASNKLRNKMMKNLTFNK